MISIRASIGEWTSTYATTHYDIACAIEGSILPLVDRGENQRVFVGALVDKLFDKAKPVKIKSPHIGGPIPRFSKKELRKLVHECVLNGSRESDVSRVDYEIESCSIRFEYTFEEGAPNRDVIVCVYESRKE